MKTEYKEKLIQMAIERTGEIFPVGNCQEFQDNHFTEYKAMNIFYYNDKIGNTFIVTFVNLSKEQL